ncbi:MAG: hypothetical protein A4E62_00402 [Syntrophorhabdus sp. PtaU1.Bin002]|nr:MAG: hypothetical protein A4E62_00402 [Syntrophorhabdus sp. PtaU1.Bin002]
MVHSSDALNLPEHAFFAKTAILVKVHCREIVRVGYEPDSIESKIAEAVVDKRSDGVFSVTMTAVFIFSYKELFKLGEPMDRVYVTKKTTPDRFAGKSLYNEKKVVFRGLLLPQVSSHLFRRGGSISQDSPCQFWIADPGGIEIKVLFFQ